MRKSSQWVLASGMLITAGTCSETQAANLLTNGDFSAGNTGFTSGYTLTTDTPFLFQNGNHGIYAVIPAGSIATSSAYGDWTNISTDPSGGNGNVFVADGATDAGVNFWSETIAVVPNTNYAFSFYGAEVSNTCCSNAVFQPIFNGSFVSGFGATGAWQQFSIPVWNSGSATSLTLALEDLNTSGGFNDFAVADLSFSGGVPEPSTWGMLLLGFAGLAFAGYRRTKARVSFAAP